MAPGSDALPPTQLTTWLTAKLRQQVPVDKSDDNEQPSLIALYETPLVPLGLGEEFVESASGKLCVCVRRADMVCLISA